MACYFGVATNPNKAFWVCFVCFFLTGVIMVSLGLSQSCNKQYNRCRDSSISYNCDDLLECAVHWFRVFIAGIVILIISTIPLCYFCCCAQQPPQSPTPPTTVVIQAQGAAAQPVVAWQATTAVAGNVNPQTAQQAYPVYQPAAPGQPYPPAYPPAPTNQPYPVHSPAHAGQPYQPAYPPTTEGQQYPAYAPLSAPPQGPVYPQYAAQPQGQPQAALTPGYPVPSGPPAAPPAKTSDIL